MKDQKKTRLKKRVGRQRRIRAKIYGDAKRPRLSVSRSAKHIVAQLIDDSSGHTIVAVSDMVFDKKNVGKKKETASAASSKGKNERRAKIAVAYEVGKLIAQKAKEKGIESAVFDRRGFKYHGRVKAVAEGAREGGLKI